MTDRAPDALGVGDSERVPNLNFYAVGDDQQAVLAVVFDLGVFRVFEAYSQPDRDLREFHRPGEVPDGPDGRHLILHALGSAPEPTAHRIESRPGVPAEATFRYSCEGWGRPT